jgi:hypothetical protein
MTETSTLECLVIQRKGDGNDGRMTVIGREQDGKTIVVYR